VRILRKRATYSRGGEIFYKSRNRLKIVVARNETISKTILETHKY
jgi:hypothetical protein